MDVSVRQELSSLLEDITHSGSASLDPKLTKTLKLICRSSESSVRAAYELTMTHLSKDHAEVRLASLQVIQDLFPRSHIFRELLISDFQKFASLVTGTDPRYPLPLPKAAAAQLKEKSLLAIRKWNDKYGDGYPKLRLGYNFLKLNKKVNFDELVAQTEAVRMRQEAQAGRQRAMLQQRIQEVKQEMKDLTCDIEDCMTQISSCFDLIMPRFDIPDIYTSLDTAGESSNDSLPRLVPEIDATMATKEGVRQGENKKQTIDVRNRTLSSTCSFTSLSDSEKSDNMGDKEVDDDILLDSENFQDEELTLHYQNSEASAVSEPSQESVEAENSDREFLRRLYGISSLSNSHQHTKTKKSGKGKVPRRCEDSEQTSENIVSESMKVVAGNAHIPTSHEKSEGVPKTLTDLPDTVQQVPESRADEQMSSNDSDSDVEWEDVDPVFPPSHDTPASHTSAEFDLQAHGISTHGFSIPIELDAVPVLHESDDNSSILVTLRESKQLLVEKYLPAINRWMEWMSKGTDQDEPLRTAIDLKHKVRQTLDKFDRIKIIYKTSPTKTRKESSSQLKRKKSSKPQVTHPEWRIHSHTQVPTFDMELDPTTPHAQIAKLRKKLSGNSSKNQPAKEQPMSTGTNHSKKSTLSSKDDLLSKAPLVPFDMDLYHWENPDQDRSLTQAPVGSLHRFWVQEREVDISTDEQARLRCRTITYPGTFEPVQKTCRARLPRGKLCPRKDRLKCPFHGPIIPRDEHGDPVSESPYATPSSSLSIPTQTTSADSGLWPVDHELQEAIRDAKGTELLLQSNKKKKGGKQPPVKKHPGLTDLKAHADTPRNRLERKILSKRALKRVAQSVDVANAKKFKDKFGYNFNYALKS